MDASDVEHVMSRFFAAIEVGDADAVAAMYREDVQVWHSSSQRAMDKARNLAVLGWLMRPGVTRRYELVEQHVVGGRVARRHVLHLTVGGHEPLVIPAAMFVSVDDAGSIHAIDEYVDSSWTDVLVDLIPR